MPPVQMELQSKTTAPTCADILRIAHEDAQVAYGDLSGYRILMQLRQDGWHVEYDLTEPFMAGGGPHYVIDAATGAILSKKYYQ